MSTLDQKSQPKISISLILNEPRALASPVPLLAPPESFKPQQSPMLSHAYEAPRNSPYYVTLYGGGQYPYYQPQAPHYVAYGDPNVFRMPYQAMQVMPPQAAPVPLNYMTYLPPQHPPQTDQRLPQEGSPYLIASALPLQALVPHVQKHRRFRRRYYQIYRKYSCSYQGCTKSYGSLNHLNTHIVTKKHGLRKSKNDFKHSDAVSLAHAGHVSSDDLRQEPPSSSHGLHYARTHPATNPPDRLSNVPLQPSVGPPLPWANSWHVAGQTLPAILSLEPSSMRLPLIPSIVGNYR